MRDDATAFEPVDTPGLNASASRASVNAGAQDAQWPSWLDSPWRVAGLWSALAIGIVGLVYALTSALSIYSRLHNSLSSGIVRISLGGLIGGALFALISGFIMVRRERELDGRDWARYGLLTLAIIPGFWTAGPQALLSAPLLLLEHSLDWMGWLAGALSLLGGLAILGMSVYMWRRYAGWRLLLVAASGLLGAAVLGAAFAPPEEHLFLEVVSSPLLLPVLIAFAALRPLHLPEPSRLGSKLRNGLQFYGGAVLFGTGTVYVLIGMAWLLQGSATVAL